MENRKQARECRLKNKQTTLQPNRVKNLKESKLKPNQEISYFFCKKIK